jgi:hypothetical protein
MLYCGEEQSQCNKEQEFENTRERQRESPEDSLEYETTNGELYW